MRALRFLLVSAVLFVVALAWNGAVHGLVLRSANASVRHLWRANLGEMMPVGLLVTAGMAMAFTWGYRRFARSGSLREALTFGLYFALVAGLLVDLNQFYLYPIPFSVVWKWFLAGGVELSLYAVLLSRLYPPVGRPTVGP
jgi:hypothetical protein